MGDIEKAKQEIGDRVEQNGRMDIEELTLLLQQFELEDSEKREVRTYLREEYYTVEVEDVQEKILEMEKEVLSRIDGTDVYNTREERDEALDDLIYHSI
jgi:DNA-dependent RNA polymerase auxiliary subunit epsilon